MTPTGRDEVDLLRGAVRLERSYRATAEELWDAWVDGGRLARWLGAASTPTLDLTGKVPTRLVLGDGELEWAQVLVLAARPPELLELRWTFAGEPDGLLRVQFRPAEPGRTLLVLDHSGLPAPALAGYGAGWQAYLDGRLAPLMESGSPGAAWDSEFERVLPAWRERLAAAR